jgi:hypothetical protein
MSREAADFCWNGALAETFAFRGPQQEMDMRKLTLTLLGGAGALIASSAYAADEIQIGDSSPLLQQVRLVCNDTGQCWHTRGDRRVIVGEGYYGPRRYYDDGYYHRTPGLGIRGPGFSVGVGPGYW